ncbi:MAG: flavin reductase family protein [Candidatus Methanogaster sp.]|uniref:Flavin reductase family protein n=1 Tax=Candidatus Methanogaster sp. TaxID=3386292 RepID=A0AC61L2J0_9EURY|nr:MAG: flavin reductase family protein [ANME-2 cluster archaeon]
MILSPNKREQFLPMSVVLISTVDKGGNRNIAPYANVIPILRPLDSVAIASWLRRDTLDNIRDTKEFVINVPSADLVNEVMICSRNYPTGVDEFAVANLSAKASQKVTAPSIERCIARMECTLDREVTEEGKYSIIIGKVVHLEVDDRYLAENEDMDFERARPLSMMLGETGMYYTVPAGTGDYRRYAEMFIGDN